MTMAIQVGKRAGMWLNKAAQFLGSPVNRVSQIINGVGTAALVLMMLLTAADVTLRYLFNRPIVGSYELVQAMMAILVAFGLAYTGVHKGHITIDLITSKFSTRVRAFINSITWIISVGVFALIAWRSIWHAEGLKASGATTSALYIPLYPFVYVVAFGSAILCLVFIVELLNHLAQAVTKVRWWSQTGLLLGILLVAAVSTVPIWAGKLGWQISPSAAGLFGIVLLIVLLFSGMPIGIVMALVGLLGMAYITGVGPTLTTIGTSPYTTASLYGFSVIPLFVLMGFFCFYSRLTGGLYRTAYRWLGNLPGGLAIATIGACAGFAAVSGSSTACAATMGAVALPEMKRYNYDPALATGCTAAGGGLGILIPPSIILAIYGILTEQSIGKLFIAGFIPGILEAILFILVIYILCRRNPLMGPLGESSSLKAKIVSLKDTWSIIVLFLLVIGGIYAGVFTPTEAAGVGAFGAFVIALSMRQLGWKEFVDSLVETSKTTAMVFLILIGANIFGYFLAVSRLPAVMSDYASAMAVNRYIVLGCIILLYLFFGCIISSIALIILTVPILFPVITALGFDPIWFGIIIVMVVEIGQLTPPVGINVFVIQGVAKDVPMYTIFRGIVPFFVAELVLVALLVAFPQIATILPDMMR